MGNLLSSSSWGGELGPGGGGGGGDIRARAPPALLRASTTDAPPVTVVVAGYDACSYFQRASATAIGLAYQVGKEVFTTPEIKEFASGGEFHDWLGQPGLPDRPYNALTSAHHTCPFVYEKETLRYIGGADDLEDYKDNTLKMMKARGLR